MSDFIFEYEKRDSIIVIKITPEDDRLASLDKNVPSRVKTIKNATPIKKQLPILR